MTVNWGRFALLLVFVVVRGCGQNAVHVPPIPRALVTHTAGTVIVDAREARPWRQALAALDSEYGWLVDYEDPIYQRGTTDLVDGADSVWRELHPLDPRGARPAGEQFVFSVQAPSASELLNGQAQTRVLTQMVEAYHHGANPGRFVMMDVGNKRFAIVGVSQSSPNGVFGCEISVPKGGGKIDETLAAIFDAVAKRVGRPVRLGLAPMNVLVRKGNVEVSSGNVTARAAIAGVLDSAHVKLVYEALFDADADAYYVNIAPAVRSY